MPKGNDKEKSFIFLEKEVSVISVVNNPKLSPYLDVFRHYPENILVQPLGILTGFFRISEFSEESSYIVNFLSSILKKEYYANPKRPIENSFDSALRKVNLALSEIAKEGSIQWLGKIDGAVCILEKNNLHFSVCGKAKVFLFRNQILTEISREMAQDEREPNPLKTFVNVSSGRMEKEDQLIICDDKIFEVFSEEEIKKGAVRFKGEKFTQFIRTALTNKLDITGTILIKLFEKEEPKPVPHKSEPEVSYNVFSKKIFDRKGSASKDLKEILNEAEKKEYTDGKTGHIYIHEENEGIQKESGFDFFWFAFKEKSADFYFWMKNKSKRRLIYTIRSLMNAKKSLFSKIKERREEFKRKKIEKKREEESRKEKEGISVPEIRLPVTIPETNLSEPINAENSFLAKLAKRRAELAEETARKEKTSIFKKITPQFGKIKDLFLKLSSKQKIYSVAVILIIIIVPYVFLKIKGAMKLKPVLVQPQAIIPETKDILSQEKNIKFLDNAEEISDIQDPEIITSLNGKIIAIGNGKITTRDTNGEIKDIAWPQNYGQPKLVSSMADLNLSLIYTSQNKVISFFSATSQFSENKIAIPENSKITGAGTYLTYLYLLDSQNETVYRFPRAEGGFGDKISWLKENIDLGDSCCMAIDENIYLIDKGEVIKLFKGKRQEFNLEKTNISFMPDRIFTDSEAQNIYILDKSSGRIIKFGKDGLLISQYFHEDLKNSTDFTIDEKGNKAYIINPQGLVLFNLK